MSSPEQKDRRTAPTTLASATTSPEDFCATFDNLRAAHQEFADGPSLESVDALRAAAADVAALTPPAGMPADAEAGLDVILGVFSNLADDATITNLVTADQRATVTDTANADALATYLSTICGDRR